MEVDKIKELTYAWRSTTEKVLEFEPPDIKEIQRLFKETYALIDKYSKEKFVPKQISGILLEMHDFSWWVCNLKDTPIHYLYQEIVSLVYKLNTYFLINKANTEEIEKIINRLNHIS